MKAPVNKIVDTYDSVIAAWKVSLLQMEGLIDGIAQQAVSGDIVLAISAWHLYPDMRVLVPRTVHVIQQDPIFASGGILTIGLEARDSQQSGVSWSLPLACLRHYGDPVVASRSVNSDERSRLTLEELLTSIVGCFLGGWHISESDTSRAIKWIAQLADILNRAAHSGNHIAIGMIQGDAASSWFSLLLSAARNHKTSSDEERQVFRKLVFLGRRHGQNFLGLPKHSLFGLTHHGSFVAIMQSEDEQIQYLRQVAKEVQATSGLENHHLIIRYKHQFPNRLLGYYEFATALPLPRKSTKRNVEEHETRSQGHCQWLYAGEQHPRYDVSDERYRRRLEVDTLGSAGNISYLVLASSEGNDISAKPIIVPPSLRHQYPANSNMAYSVRQDFEDRARIITSTGEYIYKRDYEYIQDVFSQDKGVFWPSIYENNASIDDMQKEPFYKMIYGDLNSAALLAFEGRSSLIDLAHPAEEDKSKILTLFEEGNIDENLVVEQLAEYFQLGNALTDPNIQCAKGISTAAMLYKYFPNATVDVRVLQLKLYQAHWLRRAAYNPSFVYTVTRDRQPTSTLLPYRLDRAGAFACIAMFESGLYNTDPKELENAMAMSSGDSIYASVALLRDPSQESYSHAIERVRGNIGRPGIAYLVPPVAPRIKKVAISEWPNINREDFDGKLKDSFSSTSLHLSFTGAQSRVNLDFSGAQDDDVYMLETLISVHDKGRWVADLDILKTFSSDRLCILPPCGKDHVQHSTTVPRQQMTSIDNWLELIDAPESRYAILQAHRNWEARLAAASISVSLGRHTIVLPRDVCWVCFETAVAYLCRDQRQQNIIIS